MRQLTAKQRLFVYYYTGESNRNATDAARRAGYKSPHPEGFHLLRNPTIRAMVERGVSEAGLTAHEILARLAEQATASMDDFVTMAYPTREVEGRRVVLVDEQGEPIREPTLDLPKAKRRGKLHLVKKLTPTKHGLSLELYSAQDALIRLGMFHQLWSERVTLDLQGQDMDSLSTEELLSIARGKAPDRLAQSAN